MVKLSLPPTLDWLETTAVDTIIWRTERLTNWVTELKPRDYNWVQFGEVVEVKKVSTLKPSGQWLTLAYETNKVSDICRSYRAKKQEVEYDFWGEREPTAEDKNRFGNSSGNSSWTDYIITTGNGITTDSGTITLK